MSKRDPFVDHVLEMLEPLGMVRARAMFGGFGIFHVDRMIALIANERLYFKTDQRTEMNSGPLSCWQSHFTSSIMASAWVPSGMTAKSPEPISMSVP